jgi:hypothetical protein
MRSALRIVLVLAASGLAASMASDQQPHDYVLKFPTRDVKALGEIDKLVVKDRYSRTL